MKKIQDESKYQKAKRRTDGSDWEIAKSLCELFFCELFFFFGGLVWFSYGRRRRRWKRGELCIEIRRRPTNIHIPQSKIRPDFIPNLVNFPTWFLNYRASNAKEKEKQKKNETSNKKWKKIIPMNILVDGGVVGCIYTKGYRHNKRGQEDFVWKIESLGWKQKGKGWAWRWEKRRGERERKGGGGGAHQNPPKRYRWHQQRCLFPWVWNHVALTISWAGGGVLAKRGQFLLIPF